MNVQDAIAAAKKLIAEVFAEQNISGLRLEEVEFHEAAQTWGITLSFMRKGAEEPQDYLQEMVSRQRTYKMVVISDTSGKMISIKHRDVVS